MSNSSETRLEFENVKVAARDFFDTMAYYMDIAQKLSDGIKQLRALESGLGQDDPQEQGNDLSPICDPESLEFDPVKCLESLNVELAVDEVDWS